MQHLKEIVLPNYPLVLSLLKYRNVWVFWNKKKIVLLNYPLDLSLLKYRNVWVFWNKKKSGSNRCSLLNNSIDKHYKGLFVEKKKKKEFYPSWNLGYVWQHENYFPSVRYFQVKLFLGKENIFKCFVAFWKSYWKIFSGVW